MSQNQGQGCKTEIEVGSATQSWEWESEKEPSSGFQELALRPEAGFWNAPDAQGDSLWKLPVRTCAPELFTVARLGTITSYEQLWKTAVIWWDAEGALIWDTPRIWLERPLSSSGFLVDTFDYLNSSQGLIESLAIRDIVTIWSLYLIYLNAQAKVFDSLAIWLYNKSSDSGLLIENFWVVGARSFLEAFKGTEIIQLVGSKAKIEWFKSWEQLRLGSNKSTSDSSRIQESRKFNSARYKSESGKIWEKLLLMAGYGKGSGYGLGEYGK